MKAKILAANGLDLRLFRTLPDYYRALPGKLSDKLVAMDRAGASKAELAQAMGGLRGMRLGMLEGNTDEVYLAGGGDRQHPCHRLRRRGSQPAGGVKPPAGAR